MSNSTHTHLPTWQGSSESQKSHMKWRKKMMFTLVVRCVSALHPDHSDRCMIWYKDKTFSPPGDSLLPCSVKVLWDTQNSREKRPPASPSSTQLTVMGELNPWIVTTNYEQKHRAPSSLSEDKSSIIKETVTALQAKQKFLNISQASHYRCSLIMCDHGYLESEAKYGELCLQASGNKA